MQVESMLKITTIEFDDDVLMIDVAGD